MSLIISKYLIILIYQTVNLIPGQQRQAEEQRSQHLCEQQSAGGGVRAERRLYHHPGVQKDSDPLNEEFVVGSSVIRLGEISPLWQIFKSLGNCWHGFGIWQTFVRSLAILMVPGKFSIIQTNVQRLKNNIAIWSHWYLLTAFANVLLI